MQENITSINFKHRLFTELAQIDPTLTVRSMSQLLGKSEGYWSSISAQRSAVSISGLKSLYENIECKKIIYSHDEPMIVRLSRIQELISQEIVRRFNIQTDSIGNILEAVSKTLHEETKNEQERYGAMPFVFMNRYR
jgi:hypothetical protein